MLFSLMSRAIGKGMGRQATFTYLYKNFIPILGAKKKKTTYKYIQIFFAQCRFFIKINIPSKRKQKIYKIASLKLNAS